MRYAITDIKSKEKFEDIVAEMVRDCLNKNEIGKVLFSDISSKKIIKPDRLSIIKLLISVLKRFIRREY